MADETVLLTQAESVATLTLNRPESLNALDEGLRAGLVEKLDHVSRDVSVRVVVITGAGRGFCAGADIEAVFKAQSENRGERSRLKLHAG